MKYLFSSIFILLLFNLVSGQIKGDTISKINVVGQTWMRYDLKVSTFQNGDSIYIAKSNEDWIKATASEMPALCIEYGAFFYNHYAVSDKRGLAPKGYRIPTKKDVEILTNKFGGLDTAGYFLQYQEPYEMYPNGFGDSKIGFNVNGYGHRGGNGWYWSMQTAKGDYWLRDEIIKDPAEFKNVAVDSKIEDKQHLQAFYFSVYLYQAEMFLWDQQKGCGMSVRCIKE
jgi:uncharacterized protein (TIGR02145 family)